MVPLQNPSSCACGAHFTVEHMLSCPRGGFPSIRHNEIRDITATLLTEVCNDVRVEPDRCHRKFCRPEILSRRQFFLGNSVAATIFPRRFCRSILTQRPHFLGNSVALLHRDTLPRSTAEFDIGGGTRGHWGPVPPLMSREEAASYIGNAVAAFKIERQNFLGKIVAATEFPGDRISCDTGPSGGDHGGAAWAIGQHH